MSKAALDEAAALPLERFRSFALEPPDPTVVLEGLNHSPLRREAASASSHVWFRINDEVAPRDSDSGTWDLGDSRVFTVSDARWKNAMSAVQLAAIDVVLGHPGADPTMGWATLSQVG